MVSLPVPKTAWCVEKEGSECRMENCLSIKSISIWHQLEVYYIMILLVSYECRGLGAARHSRGNVLPGGWAGKALYFGKQSVLATKILTTQYLVGWRALRCRSHAVAPSACRVIRTSLHRAAGDLQVLLCLFSCTQPNGWEISSSSILLLYDSSFVISHLFAR